MTLEERRQRIIASCEAANANTEDMLLAAKMDALVAEGLDFDMGPLPRYCGCIQTTEAELAKWPWPDRYEGIYLERKDCSIHDPRIFE